MTFLSSAQELNYSFFLARARFFATGSPPRRCPHDCYNASMTEFIEQKREALAKHLRANTQGEIRFDATSRRLYSTDASIYQIEPLGVVIPRTPADLIATVQIVADMRVPITARGGGTSLSGQSIGPGIILDCSKYLNQILDIDPSGHRVRIQPGVVLDQLNAALQAHGLLFGPDVATANRANLGGMLGNNSAGARSIVVRNGDDRVRTIDWSAVARRVAVVLPDTARAAAGNPTTNLARVPAGAGDRHDC